MEKLEMGKPFAFSVLLDLDLLVSQIGSKIGRQECKVFYEEKGKVQQHSTLREDNSAFPNLKTPSKILLYPFLEHLCFILF